MPFEESLNDAKIILVDDEEANLRLLRRILENEGYANVVPVENSKDLFEGSTLTGADLILLDLHMPPPDGFDVLKRLREPDRREQLPVLVLTGDTTPASRNQALGLGANDYVNKPFDPVEVLLRVRNLLQGRFLQVRLLRTNRLLQQRVLELEEPD